MVFKILDALHLKHSSFLLSVGVKTMKNDLVHAVPWHCMFSLSLCVYTMISIFMQLDFSSNVALDRVTSTDLIEDFGFSLY